MNRLAAILAAILAACAIAAGAWAADSVFGTWSDMTLIQVDATNYKWSVTSATTTTTTTTGTSSTSTTTTTTTSTTTTVAPLEAETFEGAGYVLSWTESGTPDEDYTTTVLEGSQSWYGATASDSAYHAAPGAIGAEGWLYCKIRFPGDCNSDYPVGVHGAGGGTIAQVATVGGEGDNLRVYPAGGTSVQIGPTIVLNTTYHLMLHFVQGSGANDCTLEGELNTDGDFSTFPDASSTNGTTTAAWGRTYIKGGDGGVIIDDMRWGTTQASVTP